MTKINGLRVIVTGASKGVGRLLSIRLIEEGARVLGVARSRTLLKKLEEKYNGMFYGIQCDLSSTPCTCCKEIIEEAYRVLGGIDVLVNNAGYAVYGRIWEQSWEDVYGQVMVNMVSAMYLTHLVLKDMLKREKGIIVFVLTGAVYAYIMGLAVYGASKAGLSYYAEALKHELEGSGIRVVTVYPGSIKGTEFFNHPSFRRKDFTKIKWDTNVEKVVDKIIEAIERDNITKVYIPWWIGVAGKVAQLFEMAVSL